MSSIQLEWTEPDSDGGAPVTAYVIHIQGPNDTQLKQLAKVDGDLYTYTVTNLNSDTQYDFQVYSENEIGLSEEARKLSKPAKTKPKASECKQHNYKCFMHGSSEYKMLHTVRIIENVKQYILSFYLKF